MRMIAGLIGPKGCGKDTSAAYLIKEAGFMRAAFADALYKEAADAFGVTVEFLGNRDTKEADLPELRLERCRDPEFVKVVLELAGYSYKRRKEMRAPRSPRFIMQLWGTEYRRRSKSGWDSYWLDKVQAIIDANPDRSFVITDVRFNNEGDFVEKHGGFLVRIRRPELEAREAADRARKGTAAHSSETEMLTRKVAYELFNVEGKPESLREGILGAIGHAASCLTPAAA